MIFGLIRGKICKVEQYRLAETTTFFGQDSEAAQVLKHSSSPARLVHQRSASSGSCDYGNNAASVARAPTGVEPAGIERKEFGRPKRRGVSIVRACCPKGMVEGVCKLLIK